MTKLSDTLANILMMNRMRGGLPQGGLPQGNAPSGLLGGLLGGPPQDSPQSGSPQSVSPLGVPPQFFDQAAQMLQGGKSGLGGLLNLFLPLAGINLPAGATTGNAATGRAAPAQPPAYPTPAPLGFGGLQSGPRLRLSVSPAALRRGPVVKI